MEKRTIEISLETAKEWYKGNNQILRNLALKAFDEKELKNYCVRSWEEFCKQYNIFDNEYYIDNLSNIRNINIVSSTTRDIDCDKNLLATKEDAKSFLALIQLKRLRDQWWESLKWKPNYLNTISAKYSITLSINKITIERIYTINRFLSFPTREIAEDFLKCFGDLIKKAKELI